MSRASADLGAPRAAAVQSRRSCRGRHHAPPGNDPIWGGWRQGESEGWLREKWFPFWEQLDLGGLWGLAWASGHPQAVASITLIDTGMVSGYRWHTLARLWRLPLVGEIVQAAATHMAFRLALARGNPRGLPTSFVDRMADNYDWGTRRAVLRFYRATNLPEIAHRYSPALRAMQVPTLVLWGRHDPYFPVRFAERQREVFPSARVVILDGSGHWPFVDDPAGVRAAFVPFLRDSLRGS